MSDAATTPAGWYPIEGELRYWDGRAWTSEIRPRLSAMERAAALDREIGTAMQAGNTRLDVTVMKTSEFSAQIISKQKINHILHFIIGWVTCGLWWLVWAGLSLSNQPRQRTLSVDEWGRPVWSSPYQQQVR